LHKATGNLFDLSEEPTSALNNAYSIGTIDAELEQSTSGLSVYGPVRLTVRVARCWSASSNSAKTYVEAVSDLVTLAETIEDALTTGPGDAVGVAVTRWRGDKLGSTADWLALDVDIEITAHRDR